MYIIHIFLRICCSGIIIHPSFSLRFANNFSPNPCIFCISAIFPGSIANVQNIWGLFMYIYVYCLKRTPNNWEIHWTWSIFLAEIASCTAHAVEKYEYSGYLGPLPNGYPMKKGISQTLRIIPTRCSEKNISPATGLENPEYLGLEEHNAH